MKAESKDSGEKLVAASMREASVRAAKMLKDSWSMCRDDSMRANVIDVAFGDIRDWMQGAIAINENLHSRVEYLEKAVIVGTMPPMFFTPTQLDELEKRYAGAFVPEGWNEMIRELRHQWGLIPVNTYKKPAKKNLGNFDEVSQLEGGLELHLAQRPLKRGVISSGRHPHIDERQIRGVTYAVIWDGSMRHVGVAYCAADEEFKPELGKLIAVNRALHQQREWADAVLARDLGARCKAVRKGRANHRFSFDKDGTERAGTHVVEYWQCQVLAEIPHRLLWNQDPNEEKWMLEQARKIRPVDATTGRLMRRGSGSAKEQAALSPKIFRG